MAFGALQVAIRALSGQKPKVNTIYMPIPVITNANFKDYYKPGVTVQDTCWADPPDGRLVPDDYFDQFFTGWQPQPKILP
jgi:ribose transport system substrate-binding protein